MKCINCASQIEANMKFCPHCGQTTQQLCPHCGTHFKPGYTYCSECGIKLTDNHISANIKIQSITHSINNHEGDIRKHASVLFADVRGSTALVEGLDPEEAKNIIMPIIEAMCAAVYSFGGTIIKTAGDGIVAIFGAPVALEDHAFRACLAALAMQDTVLKTNDTLKIRVGIHSGEVYLETIGDRGYDIVGQTVNLAARMEQTAKPGSIQITSSTFELAKNNIDIRAIGTVSVKGFKQPIETYELLSAVQKHKVLSKVKERHTFLPFTGREQEMHALNELVEKAKSGHGNVVGINGEAGQGKSRLIYEFVHKGSHAGEFNVLITGGFSHTQQTPYFPLVHALQQWMGIVQDDTMDEVMQKIHPYLKDVTTPHASDALLVLLGFNITNNKWLSLDHPIKRKYQFDTIMAILFAYAKEKPLVLIIEDSHWLDNETEAFLAMLISHIQESRVLLIITLRSEYVDHWLQHAHYTQIKLNALSKHDEINALNTLLGNHPSLEELKQQLAKNCAGNPFFLEEMIKSLIQEKVLIGEIHQFRLSEKVLANKLQLPESIFAVLQTQLDHLQPLERRILRMASVIGERFTYKMLTKIMEKESLENIQKGLRELTANEYIFQTHIYPEPESAFKHSLIHEVTYNSLLKSLRKSTHIKILGILEALLNSNQNYQLQAYHAYQGESWEKAFHYCYNAAEEMFVSLSANRSAAILFEKSLISAEHINKTAQVLEKCLHIHMNLITIYRRLCRLYDEGRHIREMEELLLLAKHKNMQSIKTLFYNAMGSYYLALGDTKKSLQWYTEAANTSILCEDKMMQAVSASASIYIYLFTGEYKTLYTKANKALKMLPELGYRHKLFPLPMGHFTNWMTSLAHAYASDYHPKENLDKKIQYLINSTNIYQSTLDAVYVSMAIGWLYFYQGLYESAIDHLSRALIFANEHEILQYIPSIAAALACANLRVNKIDEGKKLLEHALAVFNHHDSYIPKFLALDLITESYILLKDYSAAKAFAEPALEMAEHSELHGIKTTLLRLCAEIDLNLPHPDYKHIKQQLQQSIEWGERLGMVANYGHCQSVLAKLYKQMGDIKSANHANQAATQCYADLGM